MKKPKKKRIDENIMMFEEWKDSEDYLIQSWFFATDKKIRLWFEDNVLNGFEFDDFQWTPSNTYLIYTGHLEFKEKTIEYKLDLILELEHVQESKVDQFETVLSGYTIEDFVMIGQLKQTVKDGDFNATWLASDIQKFKELYPSDDKNIKLDTEVADDGMFNNESVDQLLNACQDFDELKKEYRKKYLAMSSNQRSIKAASKDGNII